MNMYVYVYKVQILTQFARRAARGAAGMSSHNMHTPRASALKRLVYEAFSHIY
jgi:hypothetical protein